MNAMTPFKTARKARDPNDSHDLDRLRDDDVGQAILPDDNAFAFGLPFMNQPKVAELATSTAIGSGSVRAAASVANEAIFDSGAPGIDRLFTPAALNSATNPTLANKEWHLTKIGVQRVWDDYTGAGVRVAVNDGGVDTSAGTINYDASKEISVNGVKENALGDGLHGTCVAGLIAGKVDSQAVGVAFGSKVTSENVFTGSTGGSGMLSTLNQEAALFDVVNNSWGWTSRWADPQNVSGSFGQLFIAALNNDVVSGRGGKGLVIVESSGNDYLSHRDGNTSEFASSRFTITVGAVTDTGDVAFYATRGADVLVSGPSGGGYQGLHTEDKVGAGGYSSGDYTDGFGGTSGAAPIVSGVAALMLQANPNLGWRDVQEIMAMSADATGSASLKGGVPLNSFWQYGWTINGANNFNGGGMHFSNDVGYGQIDAYTATRMAEVWTLFNAAQTSANEQKLSYAASALNKAVGDNQTAAFTVAVDKDIRAEHVDLTLTLTTGNINDLKIVLTSPDGTKSIVLDNDAVSTTATAQNNWTWTFGSEAFHDELTKGNWTISVTDTKGNALTSVISSYKLDIYGAAASANDVYHYTDEFAKMAAIDPSRAVLHDTNGGVDWIDMSAIAGNAVIDLHAGATETVNGAKLFTIDAAAQIENVVTGDGNDTVFGTDAANTIYTMRGDDLIFGSGGGDIIDGGVGTDTVDYSLSTAGVDVDFVRASQVGGFAQGDVLRNLENLNGSAYSDVLRGSAGVNVINGGAGNDVIEGRGGADILDGGDGIDTVSYASSTVGVDIDLTRATQVGGDAQGDVLRGFENVTGSAYADVLRGNLAVNVLDGGAGNDLLYGGAGDTLLGGTGDDRFYATGKVVVDGGAGFDTIDFSAASNAVIFDMVAGAGRTVDSLTSVTSTNVEAVVGSAFNDTLIGGLANDSLLGGAGNDLLVGGKGSDTMDGGTGYDTVDYSASSAGVDVDFTRATQVGGDAQGDILRNVEAVNGSAFNDVFRGDANANEFHAGAGNDTIFGSGGGDIIDGGTGTDLVNYSTSTAAVDVDLTRAVQIGGYAEGDKLTSVENVTGSNYNDTIRGDAGNNVIDGGAGNDAIFSGGGNDSLYGGAGDDRIVIDGLGSHVADGGVGFDTLDFSFLKASVSYNLATGVGSSSGVNVTATGIESVIGTGFNDVLVGGLGADKIDGGAGNDIIIGGVGNDVMSGGSGLDTFKFTGIGFGKDTITDFTSGQDKIDLSAMGIKSMAGITVAMSGTTEIISIGNDTITLLNQTKLLGASDFLMAA